MQGLKEKLEQQIPGLRQQAREIIKKQGDKVISHVTVSQAFGGMRGVKGLVCDTSVVDAGQGLAIRGIPIGNLACRANKVKPKIPGPMSMPYPEHCFITSVWRSSITTRFCSASPARWGCAPSWF